MRVLGWMGAALSVSCGGGWQIDAEREVRQDRCEALESLNPDPPSAPRGLRVRGNAIEDAHGQTVLLRGVNRSGTEYQCTKAGAGIFDGPADEHSVRAMRSWGINAVRVPLNESCWLALGGTPAVYSGENYKNAIKGYVELLQRNGIVPILDLHWAAPGDRVALELWPMPNVDHSLEFWRDVATTFIDNDGVIFEPYNEPFPDRNRDTGAAWLCWRDGCEEQSWSGQAYEAAGMQVLVDTIRSTGAEHVILLGGVEYSNALSGWLEYAPSDPTGNLAVAWHVYNFNRCRDLACWEGVPAQLATHVPIIATEIGQADCAGESFLKPLMLFLDDADIGYLAWSWNALGACSPRMPNAPTAEQREGAPFNLVTDYACPEPNSDYARTFRDHLLGTAQPE